MTLFNRHNKTSVRVRSHLISSIQIRKHFYKPHDDSRWFTYFRRRVGKLLTQTESKEVGLKIEWSHDFISAAAWPCDSLPKWCRQNIIGLIETIGVRVTLRHLAVSLHSHHAARTVQDLGRCELRAGQQMNELHSCSVNSCCIVLLQWRECHLQLMQLNFSI